MLGGGGRGGGEERAGKEGVSSIPSLFKVLPSFKTDIILFHPIPWKKTGLLSGSFRFNDFHEKAFTQALT